MLAGGKRERFFIFNIPPIVPIQGESQIAAILSEPIGRIGYEQSTIPFGAYPAIPVAVEFDPAILFLDGVEPDVFVAGRVYVGDEFGRFMDFPDGLVWAQAALHVSGGFRKLARGRVAR